MEGKWTYKHTYSDEWTRELYNSKEEAFHAAKNFFGKDFSIGKLRKSKKGLEYFVEDIIEFTGV
ncbi:hypothetical protein PU629_07190 [Pullulanibacillus sp. KACC 23026]|uniref:hypothetical protein n=1 Tax=Pullulanibacillus sp. KACC 23026 TaxID=3028315 RepID=UPI0023AFBAD9|nr:hypothetical protein [Pullulanibacillus sp. KACC 23026]WEG14142.1 hypothetical protein PU629_07190 [Pullulanibacillus sp. KACC 23026]